MDRVSEAILREFAEGRDLLHLGRDEQFENLICMITVGRHYSETFDTEEIVVGNGVPGIDGIAIIVNGVLMSDVDSLDELDPATELDVTFIFIQADAGASFDAAKIGSFGHAVLDFFNEKPALPQNKKVKTSAELMWALYKRGAKFKRGRPNCRLYFATTGKWVGDHILEDRIQTVISDLDATVLFREIDFDPLGAEEIQKFYQQSKNAIERDFVFKQNLTIPETAGITEAYLGFVPVPEIYKLLIDDTNNMMGNLYYSNPRDWQDYNQVNEEIRKTLGTDAKSRFVLMNNGITIIARSITRRGDIFTLEDYQIVNGCQTCHVIFEQADSKDESVTVPIRLISTQDEQTINSIIRATNRQTPVTEDQFFALEEFPKKLEKFFQTFDPQYRLYYERRSHQYDKTIVEKTRIVLQQNVIKAFAAMFLDEPHRTTRNYSALKAKVGKEIFGKADKEDPYYAAAFALYRLEYLFRNQKLEAKYKPARFHILMAARKLLSGDPIPWPNSQQMVKYCDPLIKKLWESDDLLFNAVGAIDSAASTVGADDLDRDKIRTEGFTSAVNNVIKKMSEETK